MNGLEISVIVVYSAVLLIWLARHFAVNRIQHGSRYLTSNDPPYAGDDPPLVSVIIPARDEAASIGDCIVSVLNQSYLRLEVIVVDDRSTDGTANVVREIASRDPRVRLVTVQDLPAGWTGKTNALTTGVQAARGEWFLFIDSDTRHQADNLSVLMEYARREAADMVSLLPRWRNESFWERVVQPMGGLLLIMKTPLYRVNDDRDIKTAFANGQYILIRRMVYERVGGHTAVHDKFVEDIHLARIVKANGFRLRLARAPELTSTRMYTSLGALVRGWSRILYAGYDFSATRLAILLTGVIVFSLSVYIALGTTALCIALGQTSTFVTLVTAMGFVHLALQMTVMSRIYAITACDRRYVAFYGVAATIMVWVLGSALRKCFTHHVVWRGTSYDFIQNVPPVLLPIQQLGTPALASRPLKQSA